MLKMTKRKLKAILCVVIVLVCLFIFTGMYAGDMLWLFKDYSVQFPENTMVDEEQSVTIDGYTISLKKSIYERASGLGYLIFEITSEKGVVETNMLSDFGVPISWGEAFGNDNRFTFCPELVGGCSYGIEGRRDGDKLMVYVNFEGVCETSRVPAIHLFDARNNGGEKDFFERSVHVFHCSTSSKQVFFEVTSGEVYISEHGLRVLQDAGTEMESLVVYYESDESYVIIHNGTECNGIRICLMSESESGKREVIYEIDSRINVEHISYIELNGVRYVP